MTDLASRFATALETQADVPRLSRLRSWALLFESTKGRKPSADELDARIRKQFPELKPHRRRWLKENL